MIGYNKCKQDLYMPYSYMWNMMNGGAWFVDATTMDLYFVDYEEKKIKYKKRLPNEHRGNHCFDYYQCVDVLYGVFCFPQYFGDIVLFDKESESFRNIGKAACSYVLCWDGKIICVDSFKKSLLEIDIETACISAEFLLDLPSEETFFKPYAQAAILQSRILLPSTSGNKVYDIDLMNKKTYIHRIDNIEGNIATIVYDGEKFWLSGNYKGIWIWKDYDREAEKLDSFPQGFGFYQNWRRGSANVELDEDGLITNDCFFSHSIVCDDYIWFIPCMANQIIIADKKTKKLSTFPIFEEKENKITLSKRLCPSKMEMRYSLNSKVIGVYSLKEQAIIEINMKEKKYHYRGFVFEDEDARKLWSVVGEPYMQEKKYTEYWLEALYWKMIFRS